MSRTEHRDGLRIETSRLELICCNREILDALFRGDTELASHLHITIPTKWTEFGEPAFKFTYDKIMSGADTKWMAYLPVIKASNTLIGSCGYKGSPVNGIVEIGYEVAESFRGRGYATEMARALVSAAFAAPGVSCVLAHTLAEENESGSVLKNCGFRKVGELEDPEDGRVWKWEIKKLE
jgi:RimJ/RimL family protein N-acetyltransferase